MMWLVLLVVVTATATLSPQEKPKSYDLGPDERRGGDTLSAHVDLEDKDLEKALSEHPHLDQICSYNSRSTAERAVGGALAQSAEEFVHWMQRSGARPNLTVHYHGEAAVGRCLRRGGVVQSCADAIAVLKWDRNSFYVLTSYPQPPK